jgi:hypothetical protein
VAWTTLLVAGLTEHWESDSVHHFTIGVLVPMVFYAAFDRRPWLRSLLSATIVLSVVGATTIGEPNALAPGVAIPGVGLFLLTALRL